MIMAIICVNSSNQAQFCQQPVNKPSIEELGIVIIYWNLATFNYLENYPETLGFHEVS